MPTYRCCLQLSLQCSGQHRFRNNLIKISAACSKYCSAPEHIGTFPWSTVDMNHLILKSALAVTGIPYLTSRPLVGITAYPKQGAAVNDRSSAVAPTPKLTLTMPRYPMRGIFLFTVQNVNSPQCWSGILTDCASGSAGGREYGGNFTV